MTQKLKEIILLHASYYRQTMSPEVLTMYVADLADLEISEVIAAYDSYRRNPKNKTNPLPAQIREIIEPQVSDRSAAEALTSQIIAGIKKHDVYFYPGDAAYGPAGASLVRRRGGWVRLCNEFWNCDATMFRAQMRDELEANIKYSPELVERAAIDPRNDVVKYLSSTGSNDLNKLIESNKYPRPGDPEPEGAA